MALDSPQHRLTRRSTRAAVRAFLRVDTLSAAAGLTMSLFGKARMTTYSLHVTSEAALAACGRIGSAPQVPIGDEWPRCRICNDELVAFLDLVLPVSDSSSFASGSRLQIFACRQHDDIAGTIYSDYAAFSTASQSHALPPHYWDISDGHYLLRLLPPSQKTAGARNELRLLPQFIVATPTRDDGEDGFKLFGDPFWVQDAELHNCVCGAPMRLLLQIPVGYGFRMADHAPQQPNSFSATEYCIFLGNQLYLFGCTKQCHPQALWPVLQN